MTETTLLLRQINPAWIQNGYVTSQAFPPTPKDQFQLSTYDGDLIAADQSWIHYTTVLNNNSVGVMGVTVTECILEGLQVRPDPEPFPEHAVIDFAGLSGKAIESKGKKLKIKAQDRGWLFQAP